MKTQEIFENELPDELVQQYQQRAKDERIGGGSIKIDYGLPAISIIMSSGEEYHKQEHDADYLLSSVPRNIDAKDFLLAQAQNW